MGRRGRPPSRIVLRQRLPVRKTRVLKPEKKPRNMSRGRGGARRVLRGRAKMSVSSRISYNPSVLTKVSEDVSHCKTISEINAINPSIQSELEKIMEIFSEEEEESKIFLKETVQSETVDPVENKEPVSEVINENDSAANIIGCSEAKQMPQLPEKNSVKEDEDSDKVPESFVKSLSVKCQEGKSELLTKGKGGIGLRDRRRSVVPQVRNGKVRGIKQRGFVNIGQQRGHKYFNMLSKRNRLNMYKMSMDKSPTLQRLTRSVGASPNVNLDSNPPDTKKRRKRKEFQPKSQNITLSNAACTNEMASDISFDSSQPGTSKGCNQSSSSNDMSSLPTILRNSVIERNSDSEVDEEEDMDFAKRKSMTASKEVVDVIDGIAFVTFESEHDMVRFTRSTTEESPSKADGSDRRLILESLGAIIPRKTKDIKKIKGWQKKKFSVSLNPMSEPINHDDAVEAHDENAGSIVCEHNYIRRLSSELESDNLLKSENSNGDHKIDSSEIQSKSIPESPEEESKSISVEEEGRSTPVCTEELSNSSPCSSAEKSKSTPDASKTGDWKRSAVSAFVSYRPENQANEVKSPSKYLCENELPENDARENPNKEKNNSKSQITSFVNGAVKVGKRSKLIKNKSDRSVQVDLPPIECRRTIQVNVGDVIKYPTYNWLMTFNNKWEIDLERAVFAATALANFPIQKRRRRRRRCITIATMQKEGGYSLRKRIGAINQRTSLRSAKNGAPVRITRALSNLLSPDDQLNSSSEFATSKILSPLSHKLSSPECKKSPIDDQNKTPLWKPSPEIITTSVSHLSEDTPLSANTSLINSHDCILVDSPTVTSSSSPANHEEKSCGNSKMLSFDDVPERESSLSPLLLISSDNANEAVSRASSEEVDKNNKDSIENELLKNSEQGKDDENKSDGEIKIKSSKMKPTSSEKDFEGVEWEISRHRSNLPMKEMSPDQDHEDIRVFLRPKPRFQGNQSMSAASDAAAFSSRASESSFAFANNMSPQKSSDIEVIKSLSPKSPAFARKKLIRELSKLNANFVSVDEKPKLQKKVCTKDFCKLGCVCESISTEKRVVEHCGQIECMFSCICPSKSDVPKLQVIGSDTVSRLQEESSRGMAKIEKDFHNTVVEADGELVLPGRRQRERRVPKRFLDDETINPESLFSVKKSKHSKNNVESILNVPKKEQKVNIGEVKKKVDEVNVKQCKIPIENLPIPDLQVRCLNHFTVDCGCINKFPRNVAVKSTTPRNVAIKSKSPNRIPNFSLGRSNVDSNENLNNPFSKFPDLQEGMVGDKYLNLAPTKALYVHHIQGDEVVSVKHQNGPEKLTETLINPSLKTQVMKSYGEIVLPTSCARTVGIDLWTGGRQAMWKNKSIHNITLRPEDVYRSDVRETFYKNDSDDSRDANSAAQEENAPMFKIVDVKSLPPGSFDPTASTMEEGVDQPKHFSSYENFYSWIYSSHTMCQDLRSICSSSLAPLPVNSVKLMKWKDLNVLIKTHSAHMWIRQRLGSKPRIYVTEKDIQPDAACVNFLDLEKKEEELTAQVAIILKSAKEDLSSEHSCCILICRGCYWAVAGNINLEKHSANKKLRKEGSRTLPNILMRKSAPGQTADVAKETGRLEESSGTTPLAERTLTRINKETGRLEESSGTTPLAERTLTRINKETGRLEESSGTTPLAERTLTRINKETGRLEESSGKTPLAERTLTRINSESTISPKISAELTSAKAISCSNQSEMLDPDQILSDIETSLPDILEGLVPCSQLGKAQDGLRFMNKEESYNSPKLGGNSLPSRLPASKANIQITASSAPTSPKISLLKPRPHGNNSSSVPVKSVEVSITHITSQLNNESSTFSSSLPILTSPTEQVGSRLTAPEEESFSRIVGMSQTSSSSSTRSLMKRNIENLPPAALMEGDIDVCADEDEIPKIKSSSDKDEPNSKASTANTSKVNVTDGVASHNKFIPLSKGFTVIGEGGKIIRAKKPEKKELPLEALSQALSDPSKEKLRSDPPPVLIIDLKKLRKGPNDKNEPVKIPVRVTNLKKLAQGLTEPKTMIDNISSRIGKERSDATQNSGLKLLGESGNGNKILTQKDVISNARSVLIPIPATSASPPRRGRPPKRYKTVSPTIASCELRCVNESLAISKASQNEEMGVDIGNDIAWEHPQMDAENHPKANMSSVGDKTMSGKSQVLRKEEKSAVETNGERSRIIIPQGIGASPSPSLTDDAKTILLSPSGSSELNDDNQKNLEDDLIWYRLYLNHKFDRLVFTATSFSASEKRIISAVEMARSSNRTVRISFNKNANSYLEFRKGIYAVPTIEEKYVRIGPFAKNEPTGVLLLKKDGQSYKPIPHLLVKEIEETSTSSIETSSLSGESSCLGKEESSPSLSSVEQEINEKGSRSSNESKSEQGNLENSPVKDISNPDEINLGSNDMSVERSPSTDSDSAMDTPCKEKVKESNEKRDNSDISMKSVELEKTDNVSTNGHKEGKQLNASSGVVARSSKNSSMVKAAGNVGERIDADNASKNANKKVLEGIPSNPNLSISLINFNTTQTASSTVGNQEEGIVKETTGNLHTGVSDGEANEKMERNRNAKSKREVKAKFPSQKRLDPSQNAADLPIMIEFVEGNFSAYSDLPSCNVEEENATMFENSCNELMADLRNTSDVQLEEKNDAPFGNENYRYLSNEIIEQLRRKKLIGSLSIEPIFTDNSPLTPVNNDKPLDKEPSKEQNKRKAVEPAKSPVAKKSTTGRLSAPLIPVKGYMFPDIPNLSPIPVKKGLMYSIEDPDRPGRKIELPDISTMNGVIDEALKRRVHFFPNNFRIGWTFVRAEKSSVPGMIEMKDITKDMFITSRGVLRYSDYKTMKDVKKLGLDKDEKFRYFEMKRRRETDLAKNELASIFVPTNKAALINLAKVLRKTMSEIKTLKDNEENLSQVNLIETKKKLQLEDKLNALIRAEGALTLYTPPAPTPPPPTPSPPASSSPSPSPPPIEVRRPTRGRPPRRRYMRGRWRGYRGGRGAASSGSQKQETIPSGSEVQPRNPVGRPRRGRPISRRGLTRGSLSMPLSEGFPISQEGECSPTPVAVSATVVENTIVKANELTPTKRKLKNVILPITSASPDTVRNLIATITSPKVKGKEVPEKSDKRSVPEEETSTEKSAPQETSSDDSKKLDEEKANGPVNVLLWKESFSKVKVATENTVPPPKDKSVDPKERMKKIIAESHEKMLQKLSSLPNSSKNLASWSINPPNPPSDSVC